MEMNEIKERYQMKREQSETKKNYNTKFQRYRTETMALPKRYTRSLKDEKRVDKYINIVCISMCIVQ